MKLSVIIPTYKRDELLLGLVSNFIDKQTTHIDEIIIIYSFDSIDENNKHKIENSLFLITRNSEIKIKIEFVPNQLTINAKRNIGLKNATSDYILFFDDDNEIEPEFITILKESLDKYDAVTGLTIENGNVILSKKTSSYDIVKNILRHKWGEENSFTIAVNSGFIAVKKNWFTTYGKLDENYVYSYDDYDLGWRLWESNTIVFKNKNLRINHLKAGGGSRSRFKSYKRSNMKIYSKAYFLSKHFGKRVTVYSLIIDFIHLNSQKPYRILYSFNLLLAILYTQFGIEKLKKKLITYLR